MGPTYTVVITKIAEKQLKRLPEPIKAAVYAWTVSVEELGLPSVRKVPGYHDEPLKGRRSGQRSIRLNRAYRLIYEQEKETGHVTVIVIEVNKHEY